ncbi:hypothetical protein PLICRDRAFT_33966 [Plicaturopsis crispa FD-325 SS-3]|nr:hypothetical protein PLICRDRAFT_33966 [Plicaturopsis crispa FD-325 SS-3]
MEEPPWKKIKLSLERPYKDDNGEHIPVLLDITPEGEHIYEPKDDPTKGLGDKLARIFVERGFDFFEKNGGRVLEDGALQQPAPEDDDDESGAEPDSFQDSEESSAHPMTPEELYKMRVELFPHMRICEGEMQHARDLLAVLLSSASPNDPPPNPNIPSSAITATIVSKPPPLPSVQAFDAQLVVGGKDELLRKAANIFKSAADGMERGRVRGEKYWTDALKIRRANWGLIPAPLPLGSATGKGADKTSKDFLVSFGLEESPPLFRRRAIGHMSTHETASNALVFPHRQGTRLRVSISSKDTNGKAHKSHNSLPTFDGSSLHEALRAAQHEIVEQEIFSVLIKEASNLPTASARVSERLIVIEAAQDTELLFELVDDESIDTSASTDSGTIRCDLIYSALHALLLQAHAYQKTRRLTATSSKRVAGPMAAIPSPPLLLQPIIDMLQYQVFAARVKAEIDKVVSALQVAGVPVTRRFTAVGESGLRLVGMFDDGAKRVGGEALLRIDSRHTLRFTLMSPSSLTAHLPQATLMISSIPQLTQLLSDEIEVCLLNRICEVGTELCDPVNGTWFVDLLSCRSVGRWEGCVINFRISYGENSSIQCSAFRMDRLSGRATLTKTYSADQDVSLLAWVHRIIEEALS